MDKNLPVGVIDSGVGGLSVLKVLQQALPYEDFLYIGAHALRAAPGKGNSLHGA